MAAQTFKAHDRCGDHRDIPPGYYDQLRARGKTRRQALRQLANRWVGILHICLQRRQLYDESAAWHHLESAAA